MKKNGWEEAAGLLLAVLMCAMILTVVLPVGYVVRVLLRTGSTPLLLASLVFLGCAVLAFVFRGGVFLWLTILTGIATLLFARSEEVNRAKGRSTRPIRLLDLYDL